VRLWVFSFAQQALFDGAGLKSILAWRKRLFSKGLMGVRIAIADQNRREKIAQLRISFGFSYLMLARLNYAPSY
jgi:hypothetical protein